jgi:flagellar protein FliS
VPTSGKAQEYLQVQVRTATKDQLLIMLLDGAVRFVEGARERMARGEREEKNALLQKAQNIVLELVQSLSPAIGEPLYGNLIGLYKFIYRRLVEANLRDDPQSLEEALQILSEVRETWRQAVAAFRAGLSGPAPAPAAAQGLSLKA